jgi:hypothetical protein
MPPPRNTDPEALEPFKRTVSRTDGGGGSSPRNILGAVLRKPESTAASLTGFLISALGGLGAAEG